MLTVKEAADHLGVSPIRVRQLLSGGVLDGRKSGRIWLVEEAGVSRRLRLGQGEKRYRRPLGERMLGALLAALDVSPTEIVPASGMSSAEAQRLRGYLHRLRVDPRPAQLLRAWVGTHQQMRALRYVGEVNDLLADSRFVPTGFSHPLSRITARGQLDLRCAQSDRPDLIAEYLLIEDSEPNVYVHWSQKCRQEPGFGLLLVDLAAHAGVREDEEVRHLLGGAFDD